MSRPDGYTLIEMMVTIAIVAVLAALALPSFQSLVLSTRASSGANRMLALLSTARSEAVARNRRVVICRSDTGTECSTDSEAGWEVGAMAYVDVNSDNSYDATIDGEPILAAVPCAQDVTIAGNSNVDDQMVYLPSGLAGFNNGKLTVTASEEHQRKVVISTTGRARVCNPAQDSTC